MGWEEKREELKQLLRQQGTYSKTSFSANPSSADLKSKIFHLVQFLFRWVSLLCSFLTNLIIFLMIHLVWLSGTKVRTKSVLTYFFYIPRTITHICRWSLGRKKNTTVIRNRLLWLLGIFMITEIRQCIHMLILIPTLLSLLFFL